jgi:hypothetical protein
MSWVAPSGNVDGYEQGMVRFVERAERQRSCAEAAREGLLAVALPAPAASTRGRLALYIEEGIERALECRGAVPPGVGASANLDASLSDQLYRARLLELGGLLLSLDSLAGIASLSSALDADDSAVLAFWLRATRERPVRLLLDAADRSLGVYGPPRLLTEVVADSLLSPHGANPEQSAPALAPEVASSIAAMDLAPSDVPEQTELPDAIGAEPSAAVRTADTEDVLDASVEPEFEGTTYLVAVLGEQATREPPGVAAVGADESLVRDIEASADEPTPAQANTSGAFRAELVEPLPELEAAPAYEEIDESDIRTVCDVDPAPEAEVAAALHPSAEPAHAPTAPAPSPIEPRGSDSYRAWVRELENARGPKPLAVVERLFVSSYVPLCDALANGLDDAPAREVRDSWSQSFAKSYSEAFDALRVRGKRPTMVLDIPDIALRIGRLHGARSVQLVLVDAMRFDLGLLVQERLKTLMNRQAALTERLLLWSALPANTSTQLELIGRGPDGLRDLTEITGVEVPVARGRTATTLRRVKAGSRDVMKLDVVEARLTEPGPCVHERLNALAGEAADVLAQHLQSLPARTLAVVFGDHGFVLDPMDGGTAAGRHGGCTPEEVLVPAFAWLVGSMH